MLRKRREEEPSDQVASADGVVFPAIWSLSIVERAPIPTRPLDEMLNQLTPDDEATAKILEVLPPVPVNESKEDGVEDPIPTFPLERMVKTDVPDDDATLNGLVAAFACTLKEKEEEVALTPRTVPLSIRVEVLSAVVDVQRVAQPKIPPETAAVMLSDVVATHRVEVPVDQST